MENEIKANCNCTVVKVFTEEKTAVDKGQLLIKLDSSGQN
jgi:biotin carboxyl carrier protein